uniref:hypothetical protein n=1 Tax=uncultured Varibaculum sp. TaxID=413896 RepID=UPI00259A9060
GHKNSENVATFSEFLGGRKNLAPAPSFRVLFLAQTFYEVNSRGGKNSVGLGYSAKANTIYLVFITGI